MDRLFSCRRLLCYFYWVCTSQDIPCIFRFLRWATLDLSTYDELQIEHPEEGHWLLELREESVAILGAASDFARDDYREMAELSLLALGAQPQRDVHFRRPGAYHHARWMAKVC